jgi:esterase/lipase
MKQLVKRLKKMGIALVLLLISIVGVYFLGPRPVIDLTVRPTVLPDDLDKFLAENEAAIQDIIPNTEKTIIWADPLTKAKSPYSIVYFHGFSATRQESQPLCELVAQELKANLFYTRLTGHGRTGEALGAASINDWVNDAYEALNIGRRIGEKVIVVGLSTGATLATWLAAQTGGGDIAGLVMISPNFGLHDPRAQFLAGPWGLQLMKLFLGSYREFEGRGPEHKKYWTRRYKVEAIVTMMALVNLARETTLEQIKAPTLVIYSPKDQVIDPNRIAPVTAQFQSTVNSAVAWEKSEDLAQHVLAGDILSPKATKTLSEIISQFIKKHVPVK